MKVITENGMILETKQLKCKFQYDAKKDELYITWNDFIYSEDESSISPCTVKDKVKILHQFDNEVARV